MTEPDTIEYKGEVVGKILGCEIRVVTTADGKKHFESACLSKKARDDLAAVFEEEAILRVTPKAFLEEEIPGLVKPAPKLVPDLPVSKLNPTES
ncbi:unnamed protein product [marine sediment metagenome]|uniref:Uncharacterized protein n=1 Tax=marine sediment metagenome TaxID=412755 RepID=X1QLM4_9ZZZZ